MTRKQFQTYLINRAVAAIVAAGLVPLVACSSSGHAASGKSKPIPVSTSQPSTAKLETVSATVGETSKPEVVHRMSSKPADGIATMRDDDFGISLQYPWQYGFKSGHKLRSSGEQIETSFGAPGGVNLGTIDVPAGYYSGTDFERAFMIVNVNRKLTSEQCSQFSSGEKSDKDSSSSALQPTKVELGDREYLMLSQKSDNSARRTYHTYQSGSCYEFVLGLNTRDLESDQPIKPAPVKAVFARLEKILATVGIAPDPEQDRMAVAGTPAPSAVPEKP